ncbi:receptor-like protein 46 [Hevea brasiliensis]|uniref:receptor-like protein 46 n=1 Tax=Hevea brasiliensis TaxID=3981 RepID=UPI0025CDDB0D|nr:receptor-like protein 46 [Hevea brasiliensis]
MELPTEIGNLSNIRWLQLCNNNLSGEIPPSIQKMEQLQVLDLENNLFAGEIPTCLFDFNYLLDLSLGENKLVLKNARIAPRCMLMRLSLRSCNLSGQIPIWISNQTDLAFLDLSNNNLEGTSLNGWLKEISQLNKSAFWLPNENDLLLHDLEVFWKKLKRGLPNKNLQLYTFIDLSNNQLSGEIPNSLGGLKDLKSLNLSQNKLSGRIPSSFGGLQSLESLDLSHNNFFGEIPYTLANLFELSYLDLSNNKLKDRMPSGPQMDRMNDPNSYANNSGLCGTQIKVSCEKVPSEPKLKEEKTKKSNSWEIWFSWEMAVIGYPSGFLSTVLVMYVVGYFNITPQPGRRKRRRSLVRHGLFGFLCI